MFVKALCKLSVSQGCLETQFLRERWVLQNLLVCVVDGLVLCADPSIRKTGCSRVFLPLERQELDRACLQHGAQPAENSGWCGRSLYLDEQSLGSWYLNACLLVA